MQDITEAMALLMSFEEPLSNIEITSKGLQPKRLKNTQKLTTPLYTASRNEFCPCGSGLKFKKCCINKIKHEIQTSKIR